MTEKTIEEQCKEILAKKEAEIEALVNRVVEEVLKRLSAPEKKGRPKKEDS